MKRFIVLAIAIIALLPLVIGCGAKAPSSESNASPEQAQEQSATPAPEATTPAAAPVDSTPSLVEPAPPVIQPWAEQKARKFGLVSCWYKGKDVKYYDFGTDTQLMNGQPPIAPMYVLVYGKKSDNSPDYVPDAHNIIDVVPGDDGYSDLWQVVLVTVPKPYKADSIKTLDDILTGDLPQESTEMLFNRPIVPEGSTIDGTRKLVQCWYKGQKAFYFDFGPNEDLVAPIWVMIKGISADGKPDYVAGQNNIVDVISGGEGYSAFWQILLVEVPADYKANALKSADDVDKAGYPVTPTDITVNCPM